jgi:hypothetical protein
MTGDRLQIRTKQHGQAPPLTTDAHLSPAAGPSAPEKPGRPGAALLGMLGNSYPLLSLPDRHPALNRGT